MLFVWAGVALAVLEMPGGGVPLEFTKLGVGYTVTQWLPTGLVILGVAVLCLAADPLAEAGPRHLRDRLEPQRLVPRRHLGHAHADRRLRARPAFAAMGGLALTATSGIGDALSGEYYTLNCVAAAVLGGVSLLGGVGGLIGPIAAAFVLTLVEDDHDPERRRPELGAGDPGHADRRSSSWSAASRCGSGGSTHDDLLRPSSRRAATGCARSSGTSPTTRCSC